MLGVAAVTWITAVIGGAGGAAIMSVGQLGLMGAGMFAFGALRLPGWARLRRQQMEELAGRLTHRPLLPPAPDPADER